MLTRKAKKLISANPRQEKIREDQVIHDIAVLDIAVHFMKYLGVTDIKTEKQLHQEDEFTRRVHHPDFIFTDGQKTYCVEVELSLKSRARFEQNIKSNFMKYDVQTWITDNNKIIKLLKGYKRQYPNIKVINYRRFKNGQFNN